MVWQSKLFLSWSKTTMGVVVVLQQGKCCSSPTERKCPKVPWPRNDGSSIDMQGCGRARCETNVKN